MFLLLCVLSVLPCPIQAKHQAGRTAPPWPSYTEGYTGPYRRYAGPRTTDSLGRYWPQDGKPDSSWAYEGGRTTDSDGKWWPTDNDRPWNTTTTTLRPQDCYDYKTAINPEKVSSVCRAMEYKRSVICNVIQYSAM